MKTKKTKNIKALTKECLQNILNFSFFIFHFSFLASCTYDEVNTGNEAQGKDTEVTISIAVPNQQMRTSTRALESEDEDRINSVELLVYDTSGNFDYISHGQDITDQGATNIKSFQVVLQTGNADITMLANCREILQQLYPDGIPDGITKTQLEEKIKLSLPGKWQADPQASGYIDIPMWGEIGPVNITTSTINLGSSSQPYQLYRMLAKVDVSTSASLNSQTFRLTSVRVYNMEMEGAVIPDKSNFTTVPNIPQGSNPVKGPLMYDGSAIAADNNGNNGCIGEIYLFETEKGYGKTTHPDHPCLVVGGVYKDGRELFYRIDFQSGLTYLDILRNHRYNIVITDVDDRGFKTPDEAYEAFPVGIEASVIDWSAGENEDISIGGKYVLKVSTDELVFNPDAGTQIMYVYTDHPDGWKFADDSSKPSWISFSPDKGDPDEFTEVKVTVTAQINDDDPTKIYERPVVVENVQKTIRLAQLGRNDADLEIFATPTRIIFPKSVAQPTEIQVSTYPFDMPLYFTWSGDPFEWETSFGIPVDGVMTNNRIIRLQPKTNATGVVRSGVLTIYIQDNYGHIAASRIEISQADRVDGFEATLNNPYSGSPGTYEFEASSTVAWEISAIRPAGQWTAKFSGEQAAAASQTYQFDLTGNPDATEREIEVDILLKKTPAEITTLVFKQSSLPFYLYSWPDMQQSIVVNLPSVSGTANVTFKTNSTWKHNITDYTDTRTTVYADHLTAGSYAPGTDYNSPPEPFNPKEYTLQFRTIEYGWTNANEDFEVRTPAGGTTRSSTFTISGSGTTPGNDITVTLNRTVPHMFRLNPNSNQRIGSDYAGNDFFTSVIQFEYDPNTGVVMPGQQILPSGMGLYFNLFPHTNTNFTMQTSFPGTETFTYTHGTGNMATTSSANLRNSIPENTTSANRTFNLLIRYGENGEFVIPFTQYGFPAPTFQFQVECETGWINLQTYLNTHNNTFPTGGLRIKATVGGNIPVCVFPIVNNSLNMGLWGSNSSSVRRSVMVANPGQPLLMAIMPHTGENAASNLVGITYCEKVTDPVTPQYSLSYVTFYPRTPVVTFQQNHANYKLAATGRYVARTSLYNPSWSYVPQYPVSQQSYGAANWAVSAGVDSGVYNTTTMSDYRNYTHSAVNNGNPLSCAGYKEPDQPDGTVWRLPTRAELREMYNNQYAIGGFKTTGYETGSFYYWSIENSGSQAYYLSFSNGVEDLGPKSSVCGIRCVRD